MFIGGLNAVGGTVSAAQFGTESGCLIPVTMQRQAERRFSLAASGS